MTDNHIEMHMPEGQPEERTTHLGVILGILVLALALIFCGLYLWGGMLHEKENPVSEIQAICDSIEDGVTVVDKTPKTNLKKNLVWFEEQGTSIYFYLMPFNPELCDLPYLDKIRTTYLSVFANSDYHFILNPDCSPYFTYDGRHLTAEEGEQFTRTLLKTIEIN